MALRMVGPDGYEVEAINLDGWARLRVSRRDARGYRILIAYCRTPDEVASHLDLADLVESSSSPRLPAPWRSRARGVTVRP
jgi:hypothetical protein